VSIDSLPRHTSFLVSAEPRVISKEETVSRRVGIRVGGYDRPVATRGDRPVVLVVDDEPAIRLLCRINLEFDGFEVREASTLAEGRVALEGGDVAVVLLDMHIGVESGMVLLTELLEREPHIPVAVISGSSDATVEEYRRADAVLAKPFRIDHLTATVRALAGS
jgi:DNA-binding NtrC family response regulator